MPPSLRPFLPSSDGWSKEQGKDANKESKEVKKNATGMHPWTRQTLEFGEDFPDRQRCTHSL